MKKLLIGLTLLASMSSFANQDTQNISELNILCQSDLDAVCMDIKNKNSYAVSHSCIVERIARDGSLGDYLDRGLSRIYNAIDPMCNDQQGCEQPDQSIGNFSKEYSVFRINSSEKGYYSAKTRRASMKFTDVEVEIIESIECK